MTFWLFLPVCKHCYAACVFIFHQVCADIFYSLLSIFVLHCFNADLICDCFWSFSPIFWVIFYFCVTVLHVILLIVFISDLIFMYNQSFTFIWLILFWHFVQIIWHFVQISNIWHCVHIYLINVIFGTVSRFVLVLWPLFGYFFHLLFETDFIFPSPKLVCFVSAWCTRTLTSWGGSTRTLTSWGGCTRTLMFWGGFEPAPSLLEGGSNPHPLEGVRVQTRTLSVWGGFGNSIIVQFFVQNPHPHVLRGVKSPNPHPQHLRGVWFLKLCFSSSCCTRTFYK
jgi:hypothetical protein